MAVAAGRSTRSLERTRMSPIRKTFAKHYCPRCGKRVNRGRRSHGDRVVFEVVALAVAVLVFCVVGFGAEASGIVPGWAAWVAAVVVAGAVVHVWFDRWSMFECSSCGTVASFEDVHGKGWSAF
jgi:predicted RNA-binding Zn-ribbon protein involved in translation (DUF1610 family)